MKTIVRKKLIMEDMKTYCSDALRQGAACWCSRVTFGGECAEAAHNPSLGMVRPWLWVLLASSGTPLCDFGWTLPMNLLKLFGKYTVIQDFSTFNSFLLLWVSDLKHGLKPRHTFQCSLQHELSYIPKFRPGIYFLLDTNWHKGTRNCASEQW